MIGHHGAMETSVVHVPEQSRYEIRAADAPAGEPELGFAEYRPLTGSDDDVLEFHHTLVHPQHRGHGVAERLVAAALEDVRAGGRRVKPSCWFVDQFIVEHPEYAPLRA